MMPLALMAVGMRWLLQGAGLTMPSKAPRPCRCRGCRNVTTDRDGYCDDHADMRAGWVKTQQGKTTTQRGYGHAWRKLRWQVMQRDKALCQVCLELNRITSATEVDHIVPKFQGGTDALDNLRAICHACHRDKTQSESGEGRVKSL